MIGLIGSIAINRDTASGQAIRTEMFRKVLIERYGVENIKVVNTHDFKKHAFRTLIDSLVCIFKCKHIIIMAHENGRKVYFPILYFAKKICGKRVYHNVIGGSFAEYLEKNPRLIKYAKSFDVHWVQMNTQVQKLKTIGLNNTEVLNNTKNASIVKKEDLKDYNYVPYRFCTLSRISVAKGIENAIIAIENINKKAGKTIATLDIYGKPDQDYEDAFANVLNSSSEFIQYKGFVSNDQTVDCLKSYYMLLFPSTYEGEGFPGTIWDSFAAGVPVICTDWRYNAEVVRDEVTGLVYDYHKPELLQEKIEYAINDKNRINSMKKNCVEEISNYTPDKVFPVVFKYLD